MKMKRGVLPLVQIAGLALGLACSKTAPRSAVIVVVDSDLSVPSALDQVRITATRVSDGSVLFEQLFPLTGTSARKLPLRVGLSDDGGGTAGAPFRVAAAGLLNTTIVVTRSAKVAFVKDRVVQLTLSLLSACAPGPPCPADQTCMAGGVCKPEIVDPSSLPDYPARTDGSAGADGGDASSGPDGSLDSASDRGPSLPDAGPDASINLNVGLVGYWSFDQSGGPGGISGGADTTFPDDSGNGNTVTLRTTQLPGWLAAGAYGRGADLTAVGANINVRESPSVSSITSAVTVATWIRPLGPFGSVHNIFNRFVAPTSSSLDLDFSELGMLRFTVGSRVMQTSVVVGNSEQWIHIAATYDGTRGALYVGGLLSISNALSTIDITGGGGGFTLGNRFDSINGIMYDDLDAELDELTIYNRALNAAEIYQLANGVFPTRR